MEFFVCFILKKIIASAQILPFTSIFRTVFALNGSYRFLTEKKFCVTPIYKEYSSLPRRIQKSKFSPRCNMIAPLLCRAGQSAACSL